MPSARIPKTPTAESMSVALELPPLALYLHIPWCVRKCPYCDFNSHKASETLPEADYVQAVVNDLKSEVDLAQGRRFSSIFIGGGTPSLFSPQAIGTLLEAAEQLIGFSADIEITMEANPGTFEQDKFRGFRDVGINRLSIGIQSFNDTQLQLLGRIHGREEALRATEMARRSGFDNINLDLMHGLPQQSTDDAIADLQQAIAIEPEHLSWYQLTIEPNTEFYTRTPVLPDELILGDIQDEGESLLAAAGYRQYEVSAYCRDSNYSRHNKNYWEFGDYLGVGAGAHGKVTLPKDDKIIRRRKTRLPKDYLAANQKPAAFCSAEDPIEKDARQLEALMNGLRLTEGLSINVIETRTGLPIATINEKLQRLKTQSLLEDRSDRIVPSRLGRRYLDSVLAEFI